MDDKVKVQQHIRVAMRELYSLDAVQSTIGKEHISNTPDRIAKSILEMFKGCWEDPREVLRTIFDATEYDEIVYVNNITFVSMCAHHQLPFVGKCHFGYLPDKHIVGLSKIPRLVEVYSKRPQVQEKLTCEIVDTFQEVLLPKGCGIVMEAIHFCMAIRGVENESAYTRTTALRGSFKEGSSKEEFLDGIKQISRVIWP